MGRNVLFQNTDSAMTFFLNYKNSFSVLINVSTEMFCTELSAGAIYDQQLITVRTSYSKITSSSDIIWFTLLRCLGNRCSCNAFRTYSLIKRIQVSIIEGVRNCNQDNHGTIL